VVIPQCDGGSDNGHLVFQQVPLDKIPDIVGSTYPSSVFRILGKPSDKVDISPDGKCLIHQEDTPNLRNLHVVCRTDSDPYFSDAIYVSYPKGSLEFSGWSPDSQYFVISMPSNNNSGSKVFFANPGSPAQPLLSEQVAENADTNNQAKDIKWVSSSLFLFIFKDGLCKEPFQKSGQSTAMTSIDSGPIDHDINGIYDYDFAAPP
jgi:hypothetical protein